MYNRACEEYNLLPSCLDYIHFTSILCSYFFWLLFGMYKHLRGTSIKHDMKVGSLLSILYNENYIHFFFYFILLKYILYYVYYEFIQFCLIFSQLFFTRQKNYNLKIHSLSHLSIRLSTRNPQWWISC